MKRMDAEVTYYDTDTGKTGRATLRELYGRYKDRMKASGRRCFSFSEWHRVYQWHGQITTR